MPGIIIPGSLLVIVALAHSHWLSAVGLDIAACVYCYRVYTFRVYYARELYLQF